MSLTGTGNVSKSVYKVPLIQSDLALVSLMKASPIFVVEKVGILMKDRYRVMPKHNRCFNFMVVFQRTSVCISHSNRRKSLGSHNN